MKLRQVAGVAVVALGFSLGIALPAQASVGSVIDTPYNGQHFYQGDAASVQGTCVQNGGSANVADCQVDVNNVDSSQNVLHQDLGGGADRIEVNVSIPTGNTGHFRVTVTTRGSGDGYDEESVDYYVDPRPADPPSASISSPAAGTAVNPGQSLSLTGSCSAGARASLTKCDADIVHPDGSHSYDSGWSANLPTGQSGDYGVYVTATQSDGQTKSAYTWYRVNTPPSVWINHPDNSQVINQNDSSPFDAGCTRGTGTLTSCNLHLTDPNGNTIDYEPTSAPATLPDNIAGWWSIEVTAKDSNGLTAYKYQNYRVNAYPTVEITSPLDGLRVYTDTAVPAQYSCADAETPWFGPPTCDAPVAVGQNVDTSPAGPKQFKVTATDADGAKTSQTVSYNVYDKPTAHINGPSLGTVVNPGDPAPTFLGGCAGGVPDVTCTMTVKGPDGTTHDIQSGDALPINAYGTGTITVHVVDDFGTEQTVTRNYKVNEAPHVNLLDPSDSTYFQGQDVTPTFSCYDNDHDGSLTDDSIVSCVGSPAAPLATQDTPVGTYTYKVKAVDNDGASTTVTTTYKVVPVVGSCSATGLSLLNQGFGQTGPADPCKTDDDVAVWARAPLGGVPLVGGLLGTGVSANAIEGHTVRTKPATFSARADIADATVSLLGTVNLRVTGVHSTASSTLTSCSSAQLTGTSTVGTLVLNGVPIVVGDKPLTIPLAVGALYLNQRVQTATGITERALFLDLPGTALDVKIGESSVAPRCGTL